MQCAWHSKTIQCVVNNAIARVVVSKSARRLPPSPTRTFATASQPELEAGKGEGYERRNRERDSVKEKSSKSKQPHHGLDATSKSLAPQKPGKVKPSSPSREEEFKTKEPWMLQKEALKEKFGEEAWKPRKKLSPDTMEGIRALHASDPDRFSTPVLSRHFKVTAEAIRRILKSKWQPSPEEAEARRVRWEKRGEQIWAQLAEVGVKPPKPWRVMGVGKGARGEMPKWKAHSKAKRNEHAEATTVRKDIIAVKPQSALDGGTHGVGSSISKRIL